MQDIRNGTDRYKKGYSKQFKKGVSYIIIREAYRMSEKSIVWARRNRNFKNFDQELNYGLAIVKSNLPKAYKDLKRNKMEKRYEKAKSTKNRDLLADTVISQNTDRIVTKNKKDDEDMSFLLGED